MPIKVVGRPLSDTVDTFANPSMTPNHDFIGQAMMVNGARNAATIFSVAGHGRLAIDLPPATAQSETAG